MSYILFVLDLFAAVFSTLTEEANEREYAEYADVRGLKRWE